MKKKQTNLKYIFLLIAIFSFSIDLHCNEKEPEVIWENNFLTTTLIDFQKAFYYSKLFEIDNQLYLFYHGFEASNKNPLPFEFYPGLIITDLNGNMLYKKNNFIKKYNDRPNISRRIFDVSTDNNILNLMMVEMQATSSFQSVFVDFTIEDSTMVQYPDSIASYSNSAIYRVNKFSKDSVFIFKNYFTGSYMEIYDSKMNYKGENKFITDNLPDGVTHVLGNNNNIVTSDKEITTYFTSPSNKRYIAKFNLDGDLLWYYEISFLFDSTPSIVGLVEDTEKNINVFFKDLNSLYGIKLSKEGEYIDSETNLANINNLRINGVKLLKSSKYFAFYGCYQHELGKDFRVLFIDTDFNYYETLAWKNSKDNMISDVFEKENKNIIVYGFANDIDMLYLAEIKPSYITSVDDNSKYSKNILIHPNPAKDFIYVTSDEEQVNEAEIYSLIGIPIMKFRFYNNEKLDIRNISPGLYYLRIGDIYRKFIKYN